MKIIKVEIINLSDKEKKIYHATIELELISKYKKKYTKIISGTSDSEIESLFVACENLLIFRKNNK